MAATIALGLLTRRTPELFPTVVARYGGDTLWAAMVFWLLALARPHETSTQRAVWAWSIAVAVELSQLYHAEWIDGVRRTRLGALILGHDFLWSDLACYTVGVALAAWIDIALRRSSRGAARAPSVP